MHNRQELPCLSTSQIETILQLLAQEVGLLPKQLSEQAGQNLAHLAQQLLDNDVMDRPIVVLAGRGQNGAGGLAAARHLLDQGAWVQVVLTYPAEKYAGIAAEQLAALATLGAPLAWAEEGWELPPADLIIDALIGCGLRGAPHSKVRELIYLANSSVAPILSLVAPSGLDMQSGALATPHVQATATLALALPPAELVQQPGRNACGALYLADMGISAALYQRLGLTVPALFARDIVLPLHVENDSVFVKISVQEREM